MGFSDRAKDYKIQSYPTQLLINGTKSPIEFKSHLTFESLTQFIDDLANPAYFDLDPDSFYNLVQNRPVGELWIVDFYAEW